MNISKLEVGMVIKNYKELCNLVGCEVKAGQSKIAQLKDMQCYIRFSRNKNSYIIEEIFDIKKERVYNYNYKTKPLHESVLFKYIDLELNKDLDINKTDCWSNDKVLTRCTICGEIYGKLIKSFSNHNSGACHNCSVSKNSINYDYDFELKLNKVYIGELIKNLKFYINKLKNNSCLTDLQLFDFVKLDSYISKLNLENYASITDIDKFIDLKLEYSNLLNIKLEDN